MVLLFKGITLISNLIHKKELQKQKGDTEDNLQTHLNKWDIVLILIAGLLIVFSITAPFLFTRKSFSSDFNFMLTGPIGDTIGGLMSPFINLSAVIVTGLAFYMQYRANKLQVEIFRKQLKEAQQQFKEEQEKQDIDVQKQQFESQFYEMLRLHKENVNEIEIAAKRRVENREVVIKSFAHTKKDDKYKINYTYSDYTITKRNAFVQMQKEFEFMISKFKQSDTPELSLEKFNYIYTIFFWGLDSHVTLADKLYEPEPVKFEEIIYKIQDNQYFTKKPDFDENIPFDIPAFKGHSNFLGHYYRHLFHTVKFVANYDESIVKKVEKKNYLRLLRAQLSNHEQALLFYNWLSDYGAPWQNDRNNFLTEFRMIHNLWYGQLPKEDFIKSKLKKLVNIYKDLGYKDDLFEMGDDEIIYS
ncbi:hypothetical protein B4N84_28050 [Flavobacterium sp. IR1]|nr:hypothetical protein B4N84_28050 [Flavobacterium sp. IR1]